MQTSQEAAPAAPSTPVEIKIVGADGATHTIAIPKTAAEVADLRAQRDELSSQLESASGRRDALVAELSGAPTPAARVGLEERIRVLDKRIVQLETDIGTTGQQLASAPAWLLQTRPPQGYTGDEEVESMVAGIAGTLFVVGVIYAFRRFRSRRRRKSQPAQPVLAGESAERLERLERGMESIAIEIERISEGQRFVTKLMSEQKEPVSRIASGA